MNIPAWANSVIAHNTRHWTCDYCGDLLENNRPFLMKEYRATKTIDFSVKVLCSERCEKLQNAKHNAAA